MCVNFFCGSPVECGVCYYAGCVALLGLLPFYLHSLALALHTSVVVVAVYFEVVLDVVLRRLSCNGNLF